MDRRNFLKHGVVGGAAGLIASSAYASYLPTLHPTPSETEGPFYPVLAQKDKDFDLTKIEGKQGVAKGKTIIIQGQVLDTDGNPVATCLQAFSLDDDGLPFRHPLPALNLCQLTVLVLLSANGRERSLGF